jgi:hypothetical protein
MGVLAAWSVQTPGAGAFVQINTPSRPKAVTRTEEAAWQARNENMSPNKVKVVRRLPHGLARGAFLSGMGSRVIVPFLE